MPRAEKEAPVVPNPTKIHVTANGILLKGIDLSSLDTFEIYIDPDEATDDDYLRKKYGIPKKSHLQTQ